MIRGKKRDKEKMYGGKIVIEKKSKRRDRYIGNCLPVCLPLWKVPGPLEGWGVGRVGGRAPLF